MLEYRITFARSARRELERLPRAVSTRILARIETLQGGAEAQRMRKAARSHPSLEDTRRRV